MVTTAVRVVLAGVPLVPVPRIAYAILCICADPDTTTSGCPWILLDDGDVLRLEKEQLTRGAYGVIQARVDAAAGTYKGT